MTKTKNPKHKFRVLIPRRKRDLSTTKATNKINTLQSILFK